MGGSNLPIVVNGTTITYTPPTPETSASLSFKNGETKVEIGSPLNVYFIENNEGKFIQNGVLGTAKNYKGVIKNRNGSTLKTFTFNDKNDIKLMNDANEPFELDMNFSTKFDYFMALALVPIGQVYQSLEGGILPNRYTWPMYMSWTRNPMDFVQHLASYSKTDKVLYIAGDYAYNNYDAGNFLWGMAMKRLGFEYSEVKTASEINGFFFGKMQNGQAKWYDFITLSGDQWEDQKAIKRGYYWNN